MIGGLPEDMERLERNLCQRKGLAWERLTDDELTLARNLLATARRGGHQRLLWYTPRQPWPLGSVWPELTLWQIPVASPYDHGPVVLTARRRWGRRYEVGVVWRALCRS